MLHFLLSRSLFSQRQTTLAGKGNDFCGACVFIRKLVVPRETSLPR